MWRKGNPSAVLVGMQSGAANTEKTMEFPTEKTMEFPQKTKNGTAF